LAQAVRALARAKSGRPWPGTGPNRHMAERRAANHPGPDDHASASLNRYGVFSDDVQHCGPARPLPRYLRRPRARGRLRTGMAASSGAPPRVPSAYSNRVEHRNTRRPEIAGYIAAPSPSVARAASSGGCESFGRALRSPRRRASRWTARRRTSEQVGIRRTSKAKWAASPAGRPSRCGCGPSSFPPMSGPHEANLRKSSIGATDHRAIRRPIPRKAQLSPFCLRSYRGLCTAQAAISPMRPASRRKIRSCGTARRSASERGSPA
jgi:hypothetical protein